MKKGKTMKNTLTIVSLLAILLCIQKTNGQTTVGGGIAYGTEIENIGINVTGQFFIKDNIAIAPSFTYYFPKSIVSNYSFKWYEINADGNYYFVIPDSKIKPYGLAGLNFTIASVPSIGIFGSSTSSGSSSTKLGFNMGGGGSYDIGKKILPFAQLKYTLSSFNQLAIMVGIRYKI